jgi:hypothetical protein
MNSPELDMTDTLKKLKFGDLIENGWASEDNPHRTGYFVEHKWIKTGKHSRSKLLRLTNRKGDFWEVYADSMKLKLISGRNPE